MNTGAAAGATSSTMPIGAIILPFLVILAAAIVIGIYLIPTTVAAKRRHLNKLAIMVLNIFLGWTLLGWVVALVWACTTPQSKL